MYGQMVPFDTLRFNSAAQNAACPVLDIKSWAMRLMMEQLGLADPERFVWTLRARDVETVGSQTVTNYAVVKLNYDPITLQTSSKVNNTLFRYSILDPIRPQNYADAVESQAIPLDLGRSVAGTIPGPGEFFTGLTHDDVGGIRFLMSGNNFVNEGVLPNVGLNLFSASSRARFSPWVSVSAISNILGNTNLGFPPIPGFPGIGVTNLTNFVTAALRPGLQKVTFVRAKFDSLLGINFQVVTNFFTDRFISNGIPMAQSLQRVIPQPDILFVSEDLGLAQNLVPQITGRTGTANWQNNAAINGSGGVVVAPGGPGVIAPPVRISFSDQLPFFIQSSPLPQFIDDFNSGFLSSGCWGSFDGTTNAPVIYPAYLNLTIQDLNNQ
jgi:hypothetical protein